MNVIQTLLHSSEIERIGWVLVHSLWELGAVAAVLGIVLFALRRRGANARYLAGCAAMAGVVVLAPVSGFMGWEFGRVVGAAADGAGADGRGVRGCAGGGGAVVCAVRSAAAGAGAGVGGGGVAFGDWGVAAGDPNPGQRVVRIVGGAAGVDY